MSDLSDIQKQLGLANQRVVALEQALREHPGYPSIAANLTRRCACNGSLKPKSNSR